MENRGAYLTTERCDFFVLKIVWHTYTEDKLPGKTFNVLILLSLVKNQLIILHYATLFNFMNADCHKMTASVNLHALYSFELLWCWSVKLYVFGA